MGAYSIPQERFAVFQKKIASLNKRSLKLGCLNSVVKVVGEEFKYYSDDDSITTKEKAVKIRKYINVDVEGIAPKLSGWSFLGTLDFTEKGNIFRSFPGREIPEQFRHTDSICQHCNKVRSRKNTFVLGHEDGSFKQVGRQCLRDFLGHKSPEHIASVCEWLMEFSRESNEGSGSYEFSYSLKRIVELTVSFAREYGWVSRQAQQNSETAVATSSKVFSQLNPPKNSRFEPQLVSDSDKELALDIIEWIREQKKFENSFMQNLSLVFQSDVVESRNVGIAVASYIAYEKAIGDPERKRFEASIVESNYFGEVGKREIFTLKVINDKVVETEWGTTTIINFEDAAGNKATWFASSSCDFYDAVSKQIGIGSLDKGEFFKIKATVKKHEEYKGKKQTILTRVKAI